MQQTSDNGYILAGSTNSYGHGGMWYDFWLVKLRVDLGNEPGGLPVEIVVAVVGVAAVAVIGMVVFIAKRRK